MGGAELPFKRFLVKQPGIPGKAWIAVADRKRKFYNFRKAGCFEAQGSLPVRALPGGKGEHHDILRLASEMPSAGGLPGTAAARFDSPI